MSLRKKLSTLLKEEKSRGRFTYEDLAVSGCSKTSIQYALNGGDNCGLETFDKLFSCMGYEVKVV